MYNTGPELHCSRRMRTHIAVPGPRAVCTEYYVCMYSVQYIQTSTTFITAYVSKSPTIQTKKSHLSGSLTVQ